MINQSDISAKRIPFGTGKLHPTGKVKGLMLRSDADRYTYILSYRFKGRQRRLRLGASDSMTLQQAVSAASIAIGDIAKNIDPAAVREREKAGLASGTSFKAVAAEWLADIGSGNEAVAPNTIRSYTFSLGHVTKWTRWPIASITKNDVEKLLRKVKEDVSESTAWQVYRTLSAMWTWAMEQEKVDEHVVSKSKYKPAKAPARERTLTDSELGALWNECDNDVYGHWGIILKLMVLSGQRIAQWQGLRRDELLFDEVVSEPVLGDDGSFVMDENGLIKQQALAKGVVLFGRDRVKGRIQHAIPMSPQMRALLLEAVKLKPGCPYVFGRDIGRPFKGAAASQKRIVDALGLNEHWRTHDIRRTFVSRTGRLGLDVMATETVIGHQTPTGVSSVRKAYDWELGLANKAKVLNPWGAYVDALARQARARGAAA